MPKIEPDLRPLVESLTDAERSALPGRLRRLVASPVVNAWAEAKAERDAAIEGARAALATGEIDAEGAAAAIDLARETWRARKAELSGEG